MRRKIITLSVVVCMIVSMAAYSVFAYSHSIPFSVSSATHVATVTNNTGSSKLLSVKATLSSGTGGVWVQVRNASGTSTLASKLFPYYDQSISPLTYTVSAGASRRLYVKPNTAGQTVTGTLLYDF